MARNLPDLKELSKTPDRLSPGPPPVRRLCGARYRGAPDSGWPLTSRWWSPTPPAAWKSPPPSIPSPPGACRGCTTPSRTPQRRAQRRRGGLPLAWCARASCPSRTSLRRLWRRRRHLRHRPAGAVGRHGARPQVPLRVLRQRGLHEHRHPALQRHALWRRTPPHPRGQGHARQDADARKDLTAIMAAHNIPYVAQASPHNWRDLMQKARKAPRTGRRSSTCCPRLQPRLAPRHRQTIEISRLATETCYWPLYEVENGVEAHLQAQAEAAVPKWLEAAGALPPPVPGRKTAT
jgi:hypothetical protein